MNKEDSNFNNFAIKASEKTGEFWGSIFSTFVNFGADYINTSYNCYKAGSESFKKHSQPAIEKAIDKIKENYNNEDKSEEKEELNNSSENNDTEN